MDAAIEALTERGVLAGLNLREVADSVGVTPANIYHLFGSRQGLLRAALQRETNGLVEDIDAARKLSFVSRRLQMFDVINAHPNLALTALLAIDQDPAVQTFAIPRRDQSRLPTGRCRGRYSVGYRYRSVAPPFADCRHRYGRLRGECRPTNRSRCTGATRPNADHIRRPRFAQ